MHVSSPSPTGILQLISDPHQKPSVAEENILTAHAACFQHWNPTATPSNEWQAPDVLDFISKATWRGCDFHPKQFKKGMDSSILQLVQGPGLTADIILLAFQVP